MMLNSYNTSKMKMYSADLTNQKVGLRDDMTSQETISLYQRHNLIGKGPIHDMLASNYSMDKTTI